MTPEEHTQLLSDFHDLWYHRMESACAELLQQEPELLAAYDALRRDEGLPVQAARAQVLALLDSRARLILFAPPRQGA